MQCPSCSSYTLKPTKLDSGLPARKCGKCSGVYLSMLSYRAWLESNPVVDKRDRITNAEPSDNDKILSCPSCSRLMVKYRFNTNLDRTNHIDICTHCQDVWLDSGEWEFLKLLEKHTELGSITSDDWQIKNIRQNSANHFERRYKKLLGDEEYLFLKNVADWLNTNPNKQEIIHYLLDSTKKE